MNHIFGPAVGVAYKMSVGDFTSMSRSQFLVNSEIHHIHSFIHSFISVDPYRITHWIWKMAITIQSV